MARFILRSVISTIITMLLVSGFLFFLLEVGGRDVVVNLLGVFATPEQMTSYKHQLGLDAPAWQRYQDWLIGNDWRARRDVGYPLVNVPNAKSGEPEWWADVNGQLTRWKMENGELFALVRKADGGTDKQSAGDVWKTSANKPVKNAELWQQLDAARHRHEVRWHWVKGHAGHPENERADELAREGMAPFLKRPRKEPES